MSYVGSNPKPFVTVDNATKKSLLIWEPGDFGSNDQLFRLLRYDDLFLDTSGTYLGNFGLEDVLSTTNDDSDPLSSQQNPKKVYAFQGIDKNGVFQDSDDIIRVQNAVVVAYTDLVDSSKKNLFIKPYREFSKNGGLNVRSDMKLKIYDCDSNWLRQNLLTEVPNHRDDVIMVTVSTSETRFVALSDPDSPLSPSGSDGLTPTMTSNTTPSGVAAASSIYSTTYDAWCAFDKTLSRLWISSSSTGWLKYKFDTSQTIAGYKIHPQTSMLDRAPKSWQFQCKESGNWVTKASISNFGATDWEKFGTKGAVYFNAPCTSDEFRLNITANGGSSVISIAEFDLVAYI